MNKKSDMMVSYVIAAVGMLFIIACFIVLSFLVWEEAKEEREQKEQDKDTCATTNDLTLLEYCLHKEYITLQTYEQKKKGDAE